jgi:nitrogen-specific signal transduction histidine kinase
MVVMDSSFDGDRPIMERDGIFHSAKRDGPGIGLSSVRAVAEKYGGVLKCETRDNVFLNSAYVVMEK